MDQSRGVDDLKQKIKALEEDISVATTLLVQRDNKIKEMQDEVRNCQVVSDFNRF